MTQRNSYVNARTTMTQHNCNGVANANIIPQMFKVKADTTMKQDKYYVMVGAIMKQNNNDIMVDHTTMKQNSNDVNEQTQKSNFYITAAGMTTEKNDFDVTAGGDKLEYNCNVTEEAITTNEDNSDVTVTQSSKLQGAAMVALVSLCLGCANCAINPFVFWFQIHKYRSACLEYLPCTSVNSYGNCSCYCRSIRRNAIDICGMDVDSLPPRPLWPRLSFRTRRQIHPDAAYKCTDENEDTTAT